MKLKRGIWIFVLVIVLLSQINLINSQSPGCCFHPDNFCQNTYSAQECCGEDNCESAIYDENNPCSETQCEWEGCCIQTCEKTLFKDCNYAFTFLEDLAPTYDCNSEPQCGQGCCVYITQQGTIGECELTTQSSCTIGGIYTDTQFQLGLSESECNQICEINQTMTGSLTGTVTDTTTLLSIRDVQIYVEGISTFTEINGEYFLPEIPIGTVVVEAYSQGYASFTTSVEINTLQTTTLNISLSPSTGNTGTLTGYITNTTNFPLLAYIYWGQQGVYTNSQGKYTLTDIPATNQKITILADNYISKIEYLNISPTLNEKDFQLTKSIPDETCGNDQLEQTEQCDFSSNVQGQCSPELCNQDCTCPTSCEGLGGTCFNWEYQCQGNIITSELSLCEAFDYQGSNYGCCEEEITEIPPCINGAINNEPISATDPSNGEMCECNSQYFNIENQGYCCDDTYHQPGNTCEFYGTFTGYATDENNNPLSEVTIEYTNLEEPSSYSTSSSETGFYYLELPTGEYSILATKETYSTYTDLTNILPAETKEQNITLPSLHQDCSQDNISSPTLYVNHTRGIKDLTFTWEHSCPDYVESYVLYRDENPVQTFENNIITFTNDSQIDWDTTYTYYLVANSKYQGATSQSNALNVYTGDKDCEGKTADESWCISTNRVVCNQFNSPVLWDGIIRGSPNGDCTIAAGEGSVCNYKDEESWCTQPTECTAIESGNIFGLYFTKDLCHGIDQQNYCYYDAYQGDFWTTINSCFNCEQEMTCFDYNSKYACEKDNCYSAPENSECEWYSDNKFFKLLGKGICHPKDYSGTDKCNLCAPENNIFENTQCTPQTCSALGNCFSNTNQTTCLSCDKTITCESYSTQQECTGNTNFQIEKPRCESDYQLTYSQDACNLGRCAWENNQCIKDGNADKQEDCNNNQACLLDNTAPHTIITNLPTFINYLGTTLTFSIQDASGVNATYYCLGEDNCPKKEINQTTLFLDYNELGNKQQNIFLNYYSIDNSQNVEQINSHQVYIDTILPTSELEYLVENYPASEFMSNLYITVTPNEEMFCTDSLSYSNQTYLHNKFIENQTTFEYTELQDGLYLYTLDCTDLYQNNYKSEWEILVDRIHMITDETPHLQTVSQNDLTMSIKTVGDEFYCYYTKEGEPYTHPFNPEQNGLGTPQERDYYYQSILQNLSSETYNYKIECFEDQMQNLMDSSFLSFTIDNIPPQTEVLTLNQMGKYSPLESHPYSLLNFKLNCTDQKQGPPSEAGCQASYYCFTSQQDCTPNQEYTTPTTFSEESGTYNLCYYSTDKLNNTENTKCNQIIFDTTPPELQITNPIEQQIIYNQTYLVQGTYQDISEVDIFIKTKNEYNAISESIKADTTFAQGHGTFSAQVPFFDGYNELITTAYDYADNSFSISHTVYLDTIPPTINFLEITDEYQPNDPDSDNILEYSHNLNFLLDANDEFYSDPNGETLSDIPDIDLIIICKQNTGCINENIFVKMQPGQEHYEYNYNILENPLLPGQYIASIIAQDALGNKQTYQQEFEIKETSQTILKIYNHLGERIDNANKNAEKTYPISFEIESEKTDFIEQISTTVVHSIPTLYSSEFEIQKTNNTFNYILNDELHIGDYKAHYNILDKFGRITHLTNTFTVVDTIPPTFNITIYKNQQPIEIVDYGIYDVLIESNENLLKITTLKYSFDGKTDIVHDIDGDYTTWWGKLYIPPTENYINQDSTIATFEISAQDLSELIGTEIIYGKTFTIHTTPTTPQEITPPIPQTLETSNDYSFDDQWVKTSKTVSFSATPPENLAQFNYCFVSTCYPLIDGSIFEQPYILSFTQDQKTTVSYQAQNNNGDVTEIESFKLLLDKTSPEIEISTSPNSIHQEIPISAFYRDHYNIEKITFTGDVTPFEYVPGKRWGLTTQAITLSQGDGNKTIIATAYDSAGNQQTSTTVTNLNLYTPPLTIETVSNAIKTEDYYVSSSEYLEINGSYLFEDEVMIYPKSNGQHLAESKDGKFSIIISALDGYTGQIGQQVTNNITLVIEDYFNNKYETSIIVIKNLKEGAIAITNPSTLFTNDQTPLIALSTNQHSQCNLEYWITDDNHRIIEMESENFLAHSVQIEDTFEPDAEILMNANCTELSGKNNQKNFTITIDKISPSIYNVDVNSAELVEESPLYYSYLIFDSNSTYFKVSADEPVRCKYGTEQTYNQMIKFPNFDNLEFGGQRISNTLELQQETDTYYINCEDRASNLANFATIDLTPVPKNIQILEVEPTEYTNQKNPELTFKTYRESSCIINSIPQDGEYISQIFDSEDSKYKTTDAKTEIEKIGTRNYKHTSTISAITQNPSELAELQEDQNYRFTIQCQGLEEDIEPSELYIFNFTTDFTPPYIDLTEPTNGATTNSIIPIIGTTELSATYNIYVNNNLQTFPLTAQNGEINSFAILSQGYNEIMVEAIDKAENMDTKKIVLVYTNQGNNLELANPLNRDIINPFNEIFVTILPNEQTTPDLSLTEFTIFKVDETEIQQTLSSQITTSPSSNSVILELTNNLPQGKYRSHITPISQDEIKGESENLLFEIKENIPKIYLSKPYSTYPYKHLVINTQNTEFKGTIDSTNFFSGGIYTNEVLKSPFNKKSFLQSILLDEGLTNFKITAENSNGDIAVRHGEITLDSKGPQPTIIIE